MHANPSWNSPSCNLGTRLPSLYPSLPPPPPKRAQQRLKKRASNAALGKRN
ncbi:uncharacterized protein J3R85_006347 [Psidium guajava]|nr:uncharacterized protein J3R85_006347 [Psidium guajava]